MSPLRNYRITFSLSLLILCISAAVAAPAQTEIMGNGKSVFRGDINATPSETDFLSLGHVMTT
jgi:hypothetical protein